MVLVVTNGNPCTGAVTEDTPPVATCEVARSAASAGVVLYVWTVIVSKNARRVTNDSSDAVAPAPGTIPLPKSGMTILRYVGLLQWRTRGARPNNFIHCAS